MLVSFDVTIRLCENYVISKTSVGPYWYSCCYQLISAFILVVSYSNHFC